MNLGFGGRMAKPSAMENCGMSCSMEKFFALFQKPKLPTNSGDNNIHTHFAHIEFTRASALST